MPWTLGRPVCADTAKEGNLVVAVTDIFENVDGSHGFDGDAAQLDPTWRHASFGTPGVVGHVDPDLGSVTVVFSQTGTATIVRPDEVIFALPKLPLFDPSRLRPLPGRSALVAAVSRRISTKLASWAASSYAWSRTPGTLAEIRVGSSRCSRGEAWIEVQSISDATGVPQHAWRAQHDRWRWSWYISGPSLAYAAAYSHVRALAEKRAADS